MRAGSSNVLVTGASGFVRRALVWRPVGKGYTTVSTGPAAVPAWVEAMRDDVRSTDFASIPEDVGLSYDTAPAKPDAMLVHSHETAR